MAPPLNSWIPDNVSVTLCSVPPVGQKQSATCLANTTAIQELFTRSLSQVRFLARPFTELAKPFSMLRLK